MFVSNIWYLNNEGQVLENGEDRRRHLRRGLQSEGQHPEGHSCPQENKARERGLRCAFDCNAWDFNLEGTSAPS